MNTDPAPRFKHFSKSARIAVARVVHIPALKLRKFRA